MGRMFKVIVMIILFVIAGCSNVDNRNEKNSTEIKTINAYFTGTIKEINDDLAVVTTHIEGNENLVYVNLSVNKEETFRVGDKVKVGYDGKVMESYPLQIHTLSVELVD